MKEKAQRVEELREKRPHATAKHVRIAPDKVRIVLALIRGRSVAEAMAIL
ncbi:MAG: 50S ribosomal protein L22, partial [Clostridiales bacterium]|nr:50S ribosomal protein L22 [Clostridiales bacterium]